MHVLTNHLENQKPLRFHMAEGNPQGGFSEFPKAFCGQKDVEYHNHLNMDCPPVMGRVANVLSKQQTSHSICRRCLRTKKFRNLVLSRELAR